MIEFRQVSKSFDGKAVLQDVTFSIESGIRACIIGRSGSGKSVLTRLMLGLDLPDAGSIRIDGEDSRRFLPKTWQAVLDRFGVVFQNSALFDSLSVRENVGLKLDEQRAFPPAVIQQKVVAALEQVGLSERILPQYPEQLSGGMRKRVAIARAILHEPDYLIYDEPTSGLDPINSLRIEQLIETLGEAPNRTSIIVTHDLQTVQKLADLVLFLDQRQLYFLGSRQDFFSSADPTIQEFVQRR